MTTSQEQPWQVEHVDPTNPDRTYTPASITEAVNLKARGWLPAVKAAEAPKNKAAATPGPSIK